MNDASALRIERNREMEAIRPVMLAVGGDSGTGKTTLTRGIYDIFGADNILNICLDDYHTLDRAARRKAGITALNPAMNNVNLMEEQVWALRAGKTITKPVYDHSTGAFGAPEVVGPRPIVIIRGLFPLFTERLRQAFDVRVWLAPDEELKYHWKVQRDVAQRGYLLEEVIRQIVERQDDFRQHIEPQQVHADRIVRFLPPPGYLRARHDGHPDASHLNVQIIQRATVPRVDLQDIIQASQSRVGRQPALREYDDVYQSEPVVTLEIDGNIGPTTAARIEERIWDHMHSHRHLRPDELGTFLDGTAPRHSDPLALTQLLIAYRIVAARDAVGAGAGGAPALARSP
jgi:phosphoribulokinase